MKPIIALNSYIKYNSKWFSTHASQQHACGREPAGNCLLSLCVEFTCSSCSLSLLLDTSTPQDIHCQRNVNCCLFSMLGSRHIRHIKKQQRQDQLSIMLQVILIIVKFSNRQSPKLISVWWILAFIVTIIPKLVFVALIFEGHKVNI